MQKMLSNTRQGHPTTSNHKQPNPINNYKHSISLVVISLITTILNRLITTMFITIYYCYIYTILIILFHVKHYYITIYLYIYYYILIKAFYSSRIGVLLPCIALLLPY